MCSHGKVLPDLISSPTLGALGSLGGEQAHLAKGAFAVLHRLDGR